MEKTTASKKKRGIEQRQGVELESAEQAVQDEEDDDTGFGTDVLNGLVDVLSGKAVADVAVDVVGDVIDLAAQGVTTGTTAVTGAVGDVVDTAVDVIDTTSASTNSNLLSALSMFGIGSSGSSSISGWMWAIVAFVVLGVLALLGWLLFHGETKKRR